MILTKRAAISSAGLYEEYTTRMRKIADIRHAADVLQWDQETYLPVKGAAFRGQQIASLSELAHEWFTDPSLGELLEELKGRGDLEESQQKNVGLTLEDFTEQKKFTPAFVRSLSETCSRSFHAWIRARAADSFSLFAENLEKLLALKKQEAGLAGYEGHPYNALLNQFEKGCTVGLLDKIFHDVRPPLLELLGSLRNRPQVDDAFLHKQYPRKEQWDFGMELIKELGFDFEAGRQDISEHPFTTSFNCKDVRITTRIDEKDFGSMTWSCIHEAGHALYEQGLPEEAYGLPLGEYASLSIHESQSRLWENQVGRSLSWWRHRYPRLQALFPQNLDGVSLDQFYGGINKVEPSLIRTEADEVSYHFHIMIRYELEKSLVDGSLAVNDIPGWWKEKYRDWLGVDVPDDKRGCLQDVHWSHGSFGYFATYSLGSFYAAQLYKAAEDQDDKIKTALREGETTPLLGWLRHSVHRHGRRYRSEELCRQATGETLDIRHFLAYLFDKYRNIYKF
jgi:carboxypeptidase Taq